MGEVRSMSYDYSENILVQESAGNLLARELGWDVQFGYNTEVLGKDGTFGRGSYREILLVRYFREALSSARHSRFWKRGCPHHPFCRRMRKSIFLSVMVFLLL